jgi:ABC-type nitrate/sulfonate/bicarbonate transport system substrate-binding protein
MKILLTALTAGLVALSPPSAKAQASRTVTYVYSGPTSYYWDTFAAKELGFFKEEGIDANLVLSDNVAQQTQMLLTGAADMIGANAEVAIAAIEKGAQITMIAGQTAKQGFVFVARPEIKDWADLKGKLLGATQLQDASATMLIQLMKKHGVQRNEFDLVALGGTPNRFAALTNGAVAATLLSPPLDYKALSMGMRKLGYAYEAFGGPQVVYTVQKDWAKKNEDTVVRFLRAAKRGMDWLYDGRNREKAADILVKSIGGTREDALLNYDDWVTNNKVLAEGLEVTPAGIKEFLDLRGSKDDPNKFLDLSYLRKAQGK